MFSGKSISEVISYLSVRLLVIIDRGITFPQQWHKFTFTVNKLVQKSVDGLFVERLLNRRWCLSRDNIVEESWIDERVTLEAQLKVS